MPTQRTPEQEAWAVLFPYHPPESDLTEVDSFAQRDPLSPSDPELERVNQRENDPAELTPPVDEEVHSDRHGRVADVADRLARARVAIARHAPGPIRRAKWRRR